MDYAAFRMHLASTLADGMSVEQVLSCLDSVSSSYEIRKAESIPHEPEVLTMFLDSKSVEEKSPYTLKLYKSILSQFLESVTIPVQSIRTSDIRHYLSSCKNRGLKLCTLGNIYRVLNGFFEWCVVEQMITVNPVRRIAPIRQEKSPRHAMKRIELEYLRNACADLREKALVDFLYSTGVRVSECCNARIDNIDWERKTVLIEHGKGNVTRYTFLNPESEVSLRAYLASRSDDSPYIFTKARGSTVDALTPKAIQNAIDKIVERSGRTYSVKITPHVFRHTIATVLLNNGMPVEQVQRFLGHSKVDTTLIYAEIRDEDVRRSHSLYAA